MEAQRLGSDEGLVVVDVKRKKSTLFHLILSFYHLLWLPNSSKFMPSSFATHQHLHLASLFVEMFMLCQTASELCIFCIKHAWIMLPCEIARMLTVLRFRSTFGMQYLLLFLSSMALFAIWIPNSFCVIPFWTCGWYQLHNLLSVCNFSYFPMHDKFALFKLQLCQILLRYTASLAVSLTPMPVVTCGD